MSRRTQTKRHHICAAVLRGPEGLLNIEPLELEGPRPDEILVRIVASGICHTDISFCDTWDSGDMPVVLGHEGAGVVEEVGKDVSGVAPGDHVVLSYQSCGECPSCRSGRPVDCDRFWEANFGFERLDGSNALHRSHVRGHFFGQSSFATHSLVTQRNMVTVSQDLPLDVLAPLGCGLQTGAGTVLNSLKVGEGAGIAVFGTGAVGLASIMAARIAKAHPIIGVDRVPHRLQLAQELGATHVIDTQNDDVAPRIAEIGAGGVNFVVETTGDWALHRVAIKVLKPRGTVALLAGGGGEQGLPGGRKAVGIIQGDAVPQLFIPKLIDFYRQGQFPFDRLIRFYDFTQINEAIADAKNGDTIKPVLRMSGFSCPGSGSAKPQT